MDTFQRRELLQKVAELHSGSDFWETARAVYDWQLAQNPLYRNLHESGFGLHNMTQPGLEWLQKTPFLPIGLFKNKRIQSGVWTEKAVFESSGTGKMQPSKHLVADPDFYLANTRRGFTQFYGDPASWTILALLPAYLERQGSSLVAMADYFIRLSQSEQSGFFLHDMDQLCQKLEQSRQTGAPTLLLGVSFALLDLAEQYAPDLRGITIMETGGMKGRRRELTRQELHDTLKQAFRVDAIHAEYGMTELYSQAYSAGNGRFYPAATMRVLATELNDPFCLVPDGRTGMLNIIDLANVDTCSFIQTEDLGKVYADGSFEVLGRADAAEIRGCNLMVE